MPIWGSLFKIDIEVEFCSTPLGLWDLPWRFWIRYIESLWDSNDIKSVIKAHLCGYNIP